MELTARYGMEFNPFLKNSKEILFTGSEYREALFRLDYLAGVKEGAAKVRHSTFPRPVTTKENIRRHLLFEAELLANCIRRVTG